MESELRGLIEKKKRKDQRKVFGFFFLEKAEINLWLVLIYGAPGAPRARTPKSKLSPGETDRGSTSQKWPKHPLIFRCQKQRRLQVLPQPHVQLIAHSRSWDRKTIYSLWEHCQPTQMSHGVRGTCINYRWSGNPRREGLPRGRTRGTREGRGRDTTPSGGTAQCRLDDRASETASYGSGFYLKKWSPACNAPGSISSLSRSHWRASTRHKHASTTSSSVCEVTLWGPQWPQFVRLLRWTL